VNQYPRKLFGIISLACFFSFVVYSNGQARTSAYVLNKYSASKIVFRLKSLTNQRYIKVRPAGPIQWVTDARSSVKEDPATHFRAKKVGGYFIFSSPSAHLGKVFLSGSRLPARLFLNNYGQRYGRFLLKIKPNSFQKWEVEGTQERFKIRCHGNKGYITVRPDGRVSVEYSHDPEISKLQWFTLERVPIVPANFKVLPHLPNDEMPLQVGVQKMVGVRNPTVFVLSHTHKPYKWTGSGWKYMGKGLNHIGVRPSGHLAGIRGGIIHVFTNKWWGYGHYGKHKKMWRVAIGGDERWNVYWNTAVVYRRSPTSQSFHRNASNFGGPPSEAKFLTYGTDGDLFIVTNTGRFNQVGSKIRKQHMASGGPLRIAAGNANHVYGTLSNGDLVWWNPTTQKFEYQGITLQVPVIKSQPTVESNYQSFDVSAYGKLWVIGSNGRVYEQTDTTPLQNIVALKTRLQERYRIANYKDEVTKIQDRSLKSYLEDTIKTTQSAALKMVYNQYISDLAKEEMESHEKTTLLFRFYAKQYEKAPFIERTLSKLDTSNHFLATINQNTALINARGQDKGLVPSLEKVLSTARNWHRNYDVFRQKTTLSKQQIKFFVDALTTKIEAIKTKADQSPVRKAKKEPLFMPLPEILATFNKNIATIKQTIDEAISIDTAEERTNQNEWLKSLSDLVENSTSLVVPGKIIVDKAQLRARRKELKKMSEDILEKLGQNTYQGYKDFEELLKTEIENDYLNRDLFDFASGNKEKLEATLAKGKLLYITLVKQLKAAIRSVARKRENPVLWFHKLQFIADTRKGRNSQELDELELLTTECFKWLSRFPTIIRGKVTTLLNQLEPEYLRILKQARKATTLNYKIAIYQTAMKKIVGKLSPAEEKNIIEKDLTPMIALAQTDETFSKDRVLLLKLLNLLTQAKAKLSPQDQLKKLTTKLIRHLNAMTITKQMKTIMQIESWSKKIAKFEAFLAKLAPSIIKQMGTSIAKELLAMATQALQESTFIKDSTLVNALKKLLVNAKVKLGAVIEPLIKQIDEKMAMATLMEGLAKAQAGKTFEAQVSIYKKSLENFKQVPLSVQEKTTMIEEHLVPLAEKTITAQQAAASSCTCFVLFSIFSIDGCSAVAIACCCSVVRS